MTAQDNAVFAVHLLQMLGKKFARKAIQTQEASRAILTIDANESTDLPVIKGSIGYKSYSVLPNGHLQVVFGQ